MGPEKAARSGAAGPGSTADASENGSPLHELRYQCCLARARLARYHGILAGSHQQGLATPAPEYSQKEEAEKRHPGHSRGHDSESTNKGQDCQKRVGKASSGGPGDEEPPLSEPTVETTASSVVRWINMAGFGAGLTGRSVGGRRGGTGKPCVSSRRFRPSEEPIWRLHRLAQPPMQ